MATSKIKLQISGMMFNLPSVVLRDRNWNNEPTTPYIYLSAKHVASLAKQYVKAKYPKVTCSVKSDSFAGGNSVTVYLSTPDGYSVDAAIEKDVSNFAKTFQYGRFNGMEDIYEYNNTDPKTDNGTVMDGGSKYVSVNNRPMFGTPADVCRMFRDYAAGNYHGGVKTNDEAIKSIMGYGISQKTIDAALQLG
jgi:hypothetical protein